MASKRDISEELVTELNESGFPDYFLKNRTKTNWFNQREDESREDYIRELANET